MGWRARRTAKACFVLDALEPAIRQVRPAQDQLVHHSDRVSQYLSIEYTERLAEAKIAPSVCSDGECYDNAVAKPINDLFKTEAIHRRGPWRSFQAAEHATLAWVNLFVFGETTRSTIVVCWNLSGIPRQPKQKRTSMRLWKDQTWLHT